VPTERLRKFYNTFYWPDNATAIVVGDFDPQETLTLLDKHFGVIPASPQPRPEVYTAEPPQEGERRFVVRRAGEVGAMMFGYHTPEAKHADVYPLAVVSRIMAGGVATRLYQRLVDGGLTISVRSYASHLHDPGLFEITALLRPEVEHQRLEQAIRDEIARLQDQLVGEQELTRAKNKIEADTFYARDGALNYAFALGEAEACADWQWFIEYVPNMHKVTAEEIQRVARQYLHNDNLTVGWFVPKNSNHTASISNSEFEISNSESQVSNSESEISNSEFQLQDMIAAPPHQPQFYSRGDDSANPFVGRSSLMAGKKAAASDQSGSFAERTKRVVLPNGLTLLVLENRANPTVEIRASVRAGRFFEPADQPELAAITASMLIRGTARRTKLEVAQALEDVGAEMRISANRFQCGLSAQSLSQDFTRLVETMAEVLRQPSFPLDELDKLKQQTIGHIRRHQENTGVRAMERFSQLIFERSNPFYDPSAEERIASIEAMTPDALKQFYQRHYGAGSMVLAVVGDVDTLQVESQVKKLFGDWDGGQHAGTDRAAWLNISRTPLDAAPRREVIEMPDKASVDVVMGHAGRLRRTDDDYFAAIIANAALGYSTLSSRLGVRVRDQEGLSYGIVSRFLEPTFADGPWVISVTVNPQNVDRAIQSAEEVLNKYVAEGMTDQELHDETSAFVGSFVVGLGTNGGIAAQLLSAELFGFGPKHLDEIPRLIQAVTLGQVNAAIRKYLHPEKLSIVIAGEYK
jgi:zinc protease